VKEPKTISAIEAARRLEVGLDYLYSLLWTGRLKAKKIGRNWRIFTQAVEERLKKKRGE
jgi:excisionase family DNA binding protein